MAKGLCAKKRLYNCTNTEYRAICTLELFFGFGSGAAISVRHKRRHGHGFSALIQYVVRMVLLNATDTVSNDIVSLVTAVTIWWTGRRKYCSIRYHSHEQTDGVDEIFNTKVLMRSNLF